LTGGTLQGVLLGADSAGSFTFQNNVTFTNIVGTAFEVDGGISNTFTGDVTVNGPITNDVGRSVAVSNISGAGSSVLFIGDITDSGDGILIDGNAGGMIQFSGDVVLDTMGSNAITITGNSDSTDIDFTELVDITTTSGTGLLATGGGTLTMSNTTNSVETETGPLVDIRDMEISSAGVNFESLSRTASAATSAIHLENNTGGGIILGDTTAVAGEAGSIVGGTADAIFIQDSANVSITGLTITNGSPVSAVFVEKTTDPAMVINLSDLDVTGGNMGIEVTNSSAAGNLNMQINDVVLRSPTAVALSVDNVDNGNVQVNDLDIIGNSITAAGVLIADSNATFSFNNETSITGVTGTSFEVDGGAGNITMSGSITTGATGRSAHVHDVTGGTVNFSSSSMIDDNALGIRVEDNMGGTISFLGTNDLDPAAAATEAVFIDNNTGATINFGGLNILAGGTTRGFVAQDGGTLSVTGLNNVIDTENGTALVITDMTIGSVDFQSVTADGVTGPTNAIVLQNLTGGQVTIGPSTGDAPAGGMLRSTGDAILVENVRNVDLRQLRILSAGGDGVRIMHTAAATQIMDVTIDGLDVDAAVGEAIDVTGANTNAFNLKITDGDLEDNVAIAITGSGAFGLLVDSTDITAAGTTDAFSLTFSGASTGGDVTIRNGNNFTADDGNALFIDSFGAAGKTVDILVEDSLFSNSDATSPTAAIISRETSLMNATVQGNTFTNSDAAGVNFDIRSSGAAAFVRLNLGGDGADRNMASAGLQEYRLHELLGSDFDVFLRDDTFNDLRNSGTVVTDPNDAAFDDLPIAPPLPTVPQ
jgi:hypothetical protein